MERESTHSGAASAVRKVADTTIYVGRELDCSRHDDPLLLEQDTAITGKEPPVDRGPVSGARASVDYLDKLAPVKEEVG